MLRCLTAGRDFPARELSHIIRLYSRIVSPAWSSKLHRLGPDSPGPPLQPPFSLVLRLPTVHPELSRLVAVSSAEGVRRVGCALVPIATWTEHPRQMRRPPVKNAWMEGRSVVWTDSSSALIVAIVDCSVGRSGAGLTLGFEDGSSPMPMMAMTLRFLMP